VQGELARLAPRIEAIEEASAASGQFRTDVIQGLRRVHGEEAWHRRRLREVRHSPEYERAFADPEPLISVLIPTYEHLDLLRARAIPSILAQEYRNFEIVIVGDHAQFGLEEIVAGFGDAPIRFSNLTVRGPYPEDTRRRWLVAGTSPFNEAMYLARGAWMAPFADDDTMRPHQLRALLEHARRHRLEFVYGKLHMHHTNTDLGRFPPRSSDIGLQASLLHGQLSFFELELADADFGVPNDWGRVDRLLRAGVRVGMLDEVVGDYYPSFSGEGG
jgi:glycosyltransferase involved in cell wall biosynthesis